MNTKQLVRDKHLRLTDNWVELTVRFLARDHAIRELKDAISRDILAGFNAEAIPVASSTFVVAGLPPVHVDGNGQARPRH